MIIAKSKVLILDLTKYVKTNKKVIERFLKALNKLRYFTEFVDFQTDRKNKNNKR